MLESAHESNPWAKQPPSAATKSTTHPSTPFLQQYRFHIDPTQDDENVLMTKEVSANHNKTAIDKDMEEEKSRDNSATNKTTGSPLLGSSAESKSNVKDIWKGVTHDSPQMNFERRHNELSSDDEIDDTFLGNLGNGESKAGFISRRPSMTAELETRIRHVRLSEGSDPDRKSGPSSPSAASKWGLFGMNWNAQNTILGDRKTPPQELNQPPLSPLALFQPSPFNPPAPRQVSPSNAAPGYSQTRTRFPPSQPLDPNQRVQRSQSFSIGDGAYGNSFPPTSQTAPVGHRSTIFGTAVHSTFPTSPLTRNSIEEEPEHFDKLATQDELASRYNDRGRSLSTSAAPHTFSRPRGDGEPVTDEVLYEEDEEDELEPLSRSRTLPEHTMSGSLSGLGYGQPRYVGLSTDRERLERQRGGHRQSPRITEDLPSARRQDSFSQGGSAWDEARAHRSPPRSTDYPIQSGYESYESNSMVDSPGSIHSFPGVREYTLNNDVQNYFNNDHDRRRIAEQQFHYYQMQNRFRQPMTYPSHDSHRQFQFHDPDQYTLHIVKFKANRMDVFYLAKEKKLDLQVKDYVIVDGDRGTDLGMVSKVNVTEGEARSLTAQLQREQAAATAANQNGMNANAMEAIAAAANQVQERDVTIPKKFIHRLAVRVEIDGLQMKMQDEAQAKQVCEMKAQQRGLQMDILDVEYQWDRRKLYIYFIAPQRVDFVALVKDLFKIYKTRIWLHNSTASHVTSHLVSQPSFLQSQNHHHDNHDFGVPHLQHQYDYFRSPPHRSPSQPQYIPMHHGSMFSTAGGYYSPQSQHYFPPLTRNYHPPPQPPPPQGSTATPPHMQFQSPGPPPPGHW